MFRGTTIEELTSLVQRAEAHAEQQEKPGLQPWIVKAPVAPRPETVYETSPRHLLGAA